MDNKNKALAYLNYCIQANKLLSTNEFYSQWQLEGGSKTDKTKTDVLREHIWEIWLAETIDILNTDPVYESYNTYEKLAAFYFTFFQHISDYQKYVELLFDANDLLQIIPSCLKSAKHKFLNIYKQIIQEGLEKEEIESRKVLDGFNHHLIWLQTVYLIKHWSSDASENNINTDAAIEKTTNLIADLLGRNLFDSGFDMVKFMLKRNTK